MNEETFLSVMLALLVITCVGAIAAAALGVVSCAVGCQ